MTSNKNQVKKNKNKTISCIHAGNCQAEFSEKLQTEFLVTWKSVSRQREAKPHEKCSHVRVDRGLGDFVSPVGRFVFADAGWRRDISVSPPSFVTLTPLSGAQICHCRKCSLMHSPLFWLKSQLTAKGEPACVLCRSFLKIRNGLRAATGAAVWGTKKKTCQKCAKCVLRFIFPDFGSWDFLKK